MKKLVVILCTIFALNAIGQEKVMTLLYTDTIAGYGDHMEQYDFVGRDTPLNKIKYIIDEAIPLTWNHARDLKIGEMTYVGDGIYLEKIDENHVLITLSVIYRRLFGHDRVDFKYFSVKYLPGLDQQIFSLYEWSVPPYALHK